MTQFHILTIFPDFFRGPLDYGIVRRAREAGLVEIGIHDLRAFTHDRHRTVDDRPFGGGEGMVLKPEPIFECVESLGVAPRDARRGAGESVVLLSPQGELFNQQIAGELAGLKRLVLICGRYEGVDERLLERAVDLELAVGDFVVSGGELPALLLIDAVVRQLPGVLNDAQSSVEESFVAGLLDCPHYTRPEVYAGSAVPAVLLSGDHAAVARWRLKQALGRTWLRRPELLAARGMSEKEMLLLEEFRQEQEGDKHAH